MPAMVTTRPVSVNMLLLLVMIVAMNSTHTQFVERTDHLDGLSQDNRPWSRQIRGGRNTLFRWDFFRSSKKGSSLDHGDVEELVNQLWDEKERDREEKKTRGLGKRRVMALTRYGKISSWKPSK